MTMQQLTEGLSDVLFHTTMVQSAIKIIETNRFILAADFAKGSEQKSGGAMFFLSTARSRLGSYHLSSDGYVANFTVMFKLDGRRLGQRYSGAPVDYWQNVTATRNNSDEMEDRVFSQERTIPAKPYITGVDVLVMPEDGSFKNSKLLYFVNLCKRSGYDVRLFNNRRDFIIGRNPAETGATLAAATKPEGFTGPDMRERRYSPSRPDKLTQLVIIDKMLDAGRRPEKQFEELFVGSYGWKYQYYQREILSSIGADMHNYSRKPIMADVARMMRKYRTYDMEELINKVYDRYQAAF